MNGICQLDDDLFNFDYADNIDDGCDTFDSGHQLDEGLGARDVDVDDDVPDMEDEAEFIRELNAIMSDIDAASLCDTTPQNTDITSSDTNADATATANGIQCKYN